MTERTVRRDWAKARAWLRVELAQSGEHLGADAVKAGDLRI